jgi:hypothetical protein
MRFAECLADPVLQKTFVQYCSGRENEANNVLFWLDAEDFCGRSGGGTPAQFQNLADKYFVGGSDQEIKLFDESYQLKFRSGESSKEVGAAQDVVFRHLEQIVYPGFVSSSQYQQALEARSSSSSSTTASTAISPTSSNSESTTTTPSSPSATSTSISSDPSTPTIVSTSTTSVPSSELAPTTVSDPTPIEQKENEKALEATTQSPSERPSTSSPSSPTEESSEVPVELTKRTSVYNRYGQKVIGDAKVPDSEEKKKRAQSVVERAREGKWIRMLGSWAEFCAKNPRKLSSRIRKGIPDALRARAWALMLGTDHPDNAAKYHALLASLADAENRDVIDRDVNRTFSDYVFFRQKEGQSPSQGRSALRNVLRAYACHDKELGYCQGMSFHAGVFLMYATEENAFWMLEGLLSNPRWELRGMFLPGFPLLNEYYYILDSLMKEHTPRLRQKLGKFEVATAMFAQEWFMTLFACCIPFESFLRVMDILLFKGYKILFQLAIAMLKSIENSKELATMDFSTLLLSLKGLGGRDKYRENAYAVMDTDLLLKHAFQIQLATAKLDKLRLESKKL